MTRVEDLKVKIYADGADLDAMLAIGKNPLVKGFTTNPTLMRKAGVTDYAAYARKVLAAIPDRPISFEVFADDFPTMIAQGRVIASWGRNANVKIPVTNTAGVFAGDVLRTLSGEGIVLNVTAIFTPEQVAQVAQALHPDTAAIVSVFAGRAADVGVDPVPLMRACAAALASRPKAELLWASTRELFNVFQAEETGCKIITMPNDLIAKCTGVGKDLVTVSREAVIAFHKDATAAGFSIRTPAAAA